MPRETWPQMLTRLKHELRDRADTDFASRCEGFLRRAYVEIQSAYRFYETDATATPNFTSGTQTVSLASITDMRYIQSVRNTTTKRRINLGAFRDIDKRDFTITGEPRQYARYGNTLLFDTTADQTYALLIRYKKKLTDPNFSSGTSELPEEWDNVVYYRAARAGCAAFFEHERSAWFEDQENKLVAELPIAEDVEADDSSFGLGVRQ